MNYLDENCRNYKRVDGLKRFVVGLEGVCVLRCTRLNTCLTNILWYDQMNFRTYCVSVSSWRFMCWFEKYYYEQSLKYSKNCLLLKDCVQELLVSRCLNYYVERIICWNVYRCRLHSRVGKRMSKTFNKPSKTIKSENLKGLAAEGYVKFIFDNLFESVIF